MFPFSNHFFQAHRQTHAALCSVHLQMFLHYVTNCIVALAVHAQTYKQMIADSKEYSMSRRLKCFFLKLSSSIMYFYNKQLLKSLWASSLTQPDQQLLSLSA